MTNAIYLVSGNGAAQECHVQADLVCPAGQWVHLDQRVSAELPDLFVLADRLAAFVWRDDRHFLA